MFSKSAVEKNGKRAAKKTALTESMLNKHSNVATITLNMGSMGLQHQNISDRANRLPCLPRQ
jgi:hypothetical protein